jgi:DNA-binding beta-propeller fold protein YncE
MFPARHVAVALIFAAWQAEAQQFAYPRSVAMDAKGNIYVADAEAQAVVKLDPQGGRPAVLARGEPKYRTPLYRLSGIAVAPNGELAVSDTGSSNVYRIAAGKAVPVAEADPAKSPFAQPQALAYEPSGDLIVPDLGAEAVFRVSGNRVARIASVPAPMGVCIDKAGNIIVISASHRRLTRIDRAGKTAAIAEGAPFQFPLAVAPHPDGGYVVADGYAKALFKVTPEGKISTLAHGDPLQHPTGIAAEPQGSFIVVDPHAKAIFRVGGDGKVSVLHSFK